MTITHNTDHSIELTSGENEVFAQGSITITLGTVRSVDKASAKVTNVGNDTVTIAGGYSDTLQPGDSAFYDHKNDEWVRVEKDENNPEATTGTFTTVVTDTISEKTAATGVTIDGVLLKDSQVTTDVINEKTGAAGVTLDGVQLKDSQVYTDTINEKTGAAGVTIDGVLLKDASVIATSDLQLKAVQLDTFFGKLSIKQARTQHTLTNAQTNTIALQVPAGAKLIGAQLINKTAIAGLDDATSLVPITTYAATYKTGATATIGATIAVAINTQTDAFFDTNAATDIASAATDIEVDAGVGNKFTAGGIIQADIFYFQLTSITHA